MQLPGEPGAERVCFSAGASFTVGAALIPAGAYCLYAAAVKKPSYLGLAAVPLCFGVQQIGEGFVWHALEHSPSDQAAIRPPALFFLFFALAFWPFWFPFLTMLMEPQAWRKGLFVALSLLATSWFWILFYPLLVDPNLLTVHAEHHSVQYEYPSLAIYDTIPRQPLRILYFLSVALPPALCSESWGRLPAIVLGASALLAWVFFEYAFVSVWCFFAAVLAIYLCVVFYRLPTPGTNEGMPNATTG